MKQKIREKILYRRTQQSPTDKEPKDQKIAEKIEKLPEFEQADIILLYIAIHGEVDLSKLFEKHKSNKKFVLPRVSREDKLLHLYHVDSLEDLEVSSFNIPEPKETLEEIPVENLDMVIVPGVAYTLDGHRVGYGGGFYDRFLKKISCPKIGVAYEFQIVENIQGEEHDAKVDIVVTEKKITHIKHS